MKRRLYLLVLVTIGLGWAYRAYFSTTTPFQEKENDPFEETANDWLFRQRAYPSGELDQAAYRQALRYRRNLLEVQRSNPAAGRLFTTEWTLGGPLNTGGRVTDVEMITGEDPVIYVGGASGGIFRSGDMGASWTPVFDDAPTLAIGDLALAPSNTDILYAGTGEANAGGGSIAYDGLGVYRSNDGGDTWTHLGLDNAGSIGRILVDPADADRAYVAAMGTLFANNPVRGVYRTTDGGNTWEQVLFLSDSTGAIDLAMHPSQPTILYAAMWERVRRPDRRSYHGPTSGLYRSTDGGDTWQELGGGLPTASEDKGRIGIAIAPSDPNVLYAAYAGADGRLVDIFRSDNGGDTWGPIGITGIFTVPFEWWFNRLVVSPTDPDQVYYIGFELNEYQPDLFIWQERFPGTHVDQHSLWIHPNDPDFMLLGNDGGLYFSQDGGQSFAKWENLPITQFYTCELDYQLPERLYGGTQDNGTVRTLTGALDDWQRIYGGDGFRVLVDPIDNTYVYAESQYGGLGRSVNGGASFFSATAGITAARRNWNTPVVFDPTNSATLYYGGERVFRSDNRAQTWTAVSPDLTNGSGGGNLVFGTLTSLSVSPLDNQVIWAGTDDGNVWVTEDGGGSWSHRSDALPDRWVTSVTADPNDPFGAYVTFSGYRFGSNISHIYHTVDRGQTWSDTGGDLPDIPVNDLVVNPANGTLYLATDVGVFFSENNGGNWHVLGEELPTVVITDLTFHPPSGTLVAGTYGRSMWTVNVEDLTDVAETAPATPRATVFPNPFRESATVEVEVERAGRHTLTLCNSGGRPLHRLFAGNLSPGSHQFQLSGTSLVPGVYWLLWEAQYGRQVFQVLKSN